MNIARSERRTGVTESSWCFRSVALPSSVNFFARLPLCFVAAVETALYTRVTIRPPLLYAIRIHNSLSFVCNICVLLSVVASMIRAMGGTQTLLVQWVWVQWVWVQWVCTMWASTLRCLLSNRCSTR